MSGSIFVYTFEDGNGDSFGSWTTQDAVAAEEYAMENQLRVIEHRFDWSESCPVEQWDFTPDDDEDEEE